MREHTIGALPGPFTLNRMYAWVHYPIGEQFVPEYVGVALEEI
jgi:hypothetical protein